MAKTTVYLQLEPIWGPSWTPDRVNGMRVTEMTKKRPTKARGPVVKLTISVPDAAFKPLAPEVVIDVPEGALDFEPTVTVEMPEA